jgi:hypothetical protein
MRIWLSFQKLKIKMDKGFLIEERNELPFAVLFKKG